MNVWSYWHCDACGNIIRGDSRTCPCCGSPISNDVHYMMPDNPAVIDARNQNRILIGNSCTRMSATYTDDDGITADVVSEELESEDPNWNCDYCGYQNYYTDLNCQGCGASRVESKADYFGNDFNNNNPTPNSRSETVPQSTEPKSESGKFTDLKQHAGRLLHKGIILSIIVCLVWLFIPITRTATITGFSWERIIDVETFTECHESGWTVPSGVHITKQKSEIHHYDKVLDHYETKTKRVAHREPDGYTTTYKDLGNGQSKVVKTPKYKTVYKTETYKEPVYRQEPVYRTKYYYDIGRWKETSTLCTAGVDQKPYWHDTDLSSYVDDPKYDDQKLGDRHEEYSVRIKDDKGKNQLVNYNYDVWKKLEVGAVVKYKTFRFSRKPLYSNRLT